MKISTPMCMLLSLCLNFVGCGNVLGQIKGVPLLETYSSEQLQCDSRFFAATVDNNGVVFLAAPDEESVILFDGQRARRIVTPTAPLSLVADPHGPVWVGMNDGLGYFERDPLGQYRFHPIDLQLSDSDISDMHFGFTCEGLIRFGNRRMVVEFATGTTPGKTNIIRIPADHSLVSFEQDNLLSVKHGSTCIYSYEQNRPKKVAGPFETEVDYFLNLDGTDIFVLDSFSRLVKRVDGKWQPFSAAFDESLGEHDFHWILPLSGNRLGIAARTGFYCLAASGDLIYHLNEWTGLEKSEVARFFELPDGRILLTYKSGGFSMLESDASQTGYSFDSFEATYPYAICPTQNQVLFSTNAGTFRLSFENEAGWLTSEQKFHATKISPEEVAGMFLDRQERVYFHGGPGVGLIEESRLQPELKNVRISLAGILPDGSLLVVEHGGQTGIYSELGAKPISRFRLGFTATNLVIAPGNSNRIWLGGFGSEIAVVTNTSSWDDGVHIATKKIAQEHGELFIFDWGGMVLIETTQGIFRLVLIEDRIELRECHEFALLNPKLQSLAHYNLVTCGEMGALVNTMDVISLYPFERGQFRSTPSAQWVAPGGYRRCLEYDRFRSVAWTVANNQLVAVDISKPSRLQYLPPLIETRCREPVVEPTEGPVSLPPIGSIVFDYFVPAFPKRRRPIEYQFRLRPDSQWSAWTRETRKEYNRLPGGNYRFEVRSRYQDGDLFGSQTVPIEVAFPWYQSSLAYLGFALTGLGIVYGLVLLRTRRLAQANLRMEKIAEARAIEIDQKKREIRAKANELIQLDRTKEAERLESLDTLVAGVAHDFNNLLTVIASQNELIEFRAGDQVGDLTSDARHAIELAADLCRELSAISNASPLTLSRKSLGEFLREQESLLVRAIPSTIETEFTYTDEPDYFDCDPQQLKRVILNLAINAGEAALTRIAVKTKVMELTAQRLNSARSTGHTPSPGKFVVLEIVDDGPGIPKENQARLFDTFFSTKKLGRGLGLAIVLKTVSRHGGLVLLDSDSTGTRFQACFPNLDASSAPANQAVTSHSDSLFNILLVDDDHSVLAATKRLLTLMGHTVVTGLSGEEGVELFKETPEVQLVIADLSMPGLKGSEMAEQILLSDPDFPILLVSGYTADSICHRILERPNVGFLSKPFDLAQLKNAIESLSSSSSKIA